MLAPPRIGIYVAPAILAVLLQLFSLSPSRAQSTLPNLSWRDTDGKAQALSDYRGKIVVLNFWATWCLPCTHEITMLADMHKQYQSRGVVFLGASVDDEKTHGQIPAFAKRLKIPFVLLVDATTEEMQKLGLGEVIPATAFFDANGKLAARVLGEMKKSDLKHRLEWMMGNHRGTEPPAFLDGFKKNTKPTPPPIPIPR